MQDIKKKFWLEKFDCFSITGKDSKRFLNGITTGNVVDLNNKILKTCWLSPNGVLKSLLEINCLENQLEVIVLLEILVKLEITLMILFSPQMMFY